MEFSAQESIGLLGRRLESNYVLGYRRHRIQDVLVATSKRKKYIYDGSMMSRDVDGKAEKLCPPNY